MHVFLGALRVKKNMNKKAHQMMASMGFNDFIWDFGKLPFPSHLGKYIIKIGKISTKIHKIGKIKAIFGLGMIPI